MFVRARALEAVGPWPAGWQAQDGASRAVHDAAGDGDEAGADSRATVSVSLVRVPPRIVVQRMRLCAERGAGQPGAIGGEVTGRHVLEPGAFFEVADREFDYGMVTVELVSVDCAALTVAGDERMVAPVRPQFGLRADQASAAHDQPHGPLLVGAAGRVHGLGDFGVAADGVVDRRPRRFVDRGDRPSNTGLLRDGDRPANPEVVQRVDELPGPEPAVGPQRQRAGRAGATDPGDQFLSETTMAALRRTFAQPPVQQFAGVGTHREERVQAELARVAIGGALLVVAVHLADRRVEIDHQLVVAGPRARRPCPTQRFRGNLVELAEMPERERPQERAQRRGSHHPEPQHPLRRAPRSMLA